MLLLPLVVARRHCLRTLSTAPSPPNDKLAQALSGILGPEDAPVPEHPPQGPPGVLPPGGPRVSEQKRNPYALPESTEKQKHIYHLHVLASRNNTILTFTDPVHKPRAWVSAGSCGFKHVQRSGYEAGYRCAVKMFDVIAKHREEQHMIMRLEILFNGFGNGREAFYRALMTAEGDKIRDAVYKLTDTTPLKIGGGVRAKKARRL